MRPSLFLLTPILTIVGCGLSTNSENIITITDKEINIVDANDDSLRILKMYFIIDSVSEIMDICILEASNNDSKMVEEKYRPILIELHDSLSSTIYELQMSFMKQKKTEEEFIEFMRQFNIEKLRIKADSISKLGIKTVKD